MKPSLKVLQELEWEYRCSNTKMPKDYVPKTIFTDKTANGLTKCIVTWITINGYQAERISNTGRYIDNSKIVTDSMGFQKRIGSGQYIKGSGTNGTADISSTIGVRINDKLIGLSVKWEVKMKDRQSNAQKQYEENIHRAGGLYFIVHDFDEFMKYYKGIIENKY